MTEGHVREVITDPIVIEDEDGEISDQARDLRRLDIYQQQILKLQHEKDQLLKQAVARKRAEQICQAIRQAESHRERLIREIQQLQRAGGESTNHVHGSTVSPDIGLLDENIEMYDPTSPLSKELQ